jgi:hypothetical protein
MGRFRIFLVSFWKELATSRTISFAVFAGIAAMIVLVSSPVRSQQSDCMIQSIRKGKSYTDAADDNFNRLNDCIKDLSAKVDKLTSDLKALTRSVATGLSIDDLQRRLYVKSTEAQKRKRCDAYAVAAANRPGNPFEQSILEEKCGPGEVRVSGGCDFTCFNIEHIQSIPTENGWQCGAKSTDPGRTFGTYVICLRPTDALR